MIEFCVKKTDDVFDDVRQQINAMTMEAFQFCNLFSYLVDNPGIHILAYEGNILVGHTVITERTFCLKELTLRAAYIDSVVITPVRRGHGIGKMIMDKVKYVSEENDFDIMGLSTDKVVFYEKCGWERWIGELAINKNGEIIETPDEKDVMICRLKKTPSLRTDSKLVASWRPDHFW